MPLTLEQHRMRAAEAAAKTVLDAQLQAPWRTMMLGFGAEVQRCGLLLATAYLHRGDKTRCSAIATEAIRDHLAAHGFVTLTRAQRAAGVPLLDLLRDLDAMAYAVVTREVIALSVWLRRVTQARMPRQAPAAPVEA